GGPGTRGRGDGRRSHTELESRRRYLETVLANIAAGVISTDGEGHITTMNRAAETLLGVPAAACVGRGIDAVFTGDAYADVRELAADLRTEAPSAPSYAIAVGGPLRALDGDNGRAAPLAR